jgi:hypothetical protein
VKKPTLESWEPVVSAALAYQRAYDDRQPTARQQDYALTIVEECRRLRKGGSK